MHNKKLDAIFDDLKNGVRAIFESPNYKHYLEVMARFHNYSANNWRLIYKQCPNATKVAGYKQWQEDFDRYVKKGEKAIRIIAPSKDYGFIEVCVFDFSQTDGAPLPTDGIVAYQLKSNVKNYNILLEVLKKVSPLPIFFEKLNGPNGQCWFNNKILINTGMSEAQNLKTLIHEIAHAILHTNSTASKNFKEVEAESVAFAVCAYLGVDTSSYSFGYVAGYSKDETDDILLKSLDTITKTTKSLIQQIRKELGLSNEEIVLKDAIAQSLYEEGLQYCNDSNKNKDYNKAFQYFLDAASYEHKEAICKVASYYEKGIGTNRDNLKAIYWYMKISDTCCAQYHLAILYQTEKNLKESFKWFLKAAEQGHQVANKELMSFLESGKWSYLCTRESFNWLREVAKQGHKIAQYELGNHYFTGYVVEQNYIAALIWYLDSAKQHYPYAQYMLGLCYKNGYGITASFEKSFEYFKLVADTTKIDLCGAAKYELANYYREGLGVEKDLSKAFELYQAAMADGHINAKFELAQFYFNGVITEKNIEKGVELLLDATHKGSIEAKSQVIETFVSADNYNKQMNQSFVNRIKNYFSQFIAKYLKM